jgi:hypothetical protein
MWRALHKTITTYSTLSTGWFWSKNVLMLQMCMSHIPSLLALNASTCCNFLPVNAQLFMQDDAVRRSMNIIMGFLHDTFVPSVNSDEYPDFHTHGRSGPQFQLH